jgi:ABC-2 type transport system ATP-binding protein
MQPLHRVCVEGDMLAGILGSVDLAPEALAKPVRLLSKGMAQKLGLAAVLASGKPLLILDEPMSGLDPKARALLKRSLLQRKALGQTLFFSTHMLADVEALCDRMAVLHDGVLKFVGTPSELCRRYETDSLEAAFLACVA